MIGSALFGAWKRYREYQERVQDLHREVVTDYRTQMAPGIHRGANSLLASTAPQVDQKSLRDLHRAFRTIDTELSKNLNRRLKTEVAEPIADRARGRAPVGKSGKFAKSIRAGATQKGPYVAWGRKSVPYAGWLEFGGPRRTRTGGVESSRPYRPEGRYVFPTVEAEKDRALRTVEQVMDDAIRRAGF